MGLVISKTKWKAATASVMRPSTIAIIHSLVEGAGAARLLFSLLEYWVHAKSFTNREHDGAPLKFLFILAGDLEQLTGMSGKQLERAFADLKSSPYVIVKMGRRSPQETINGRLIHIRVQAIWFEVNGMTDATKMTLVDKGDGIKVPDFKVNKSGLPYLFRRLFEAAGGAA